MKVVFAHDHKFFRASNDVYYSAGNFPYHVWERYLYIFDEILVVARTQKMDSNKRLLKSSGPNVTFIPVPSINSLSSRLFKYFGVKKTISETLKKSDALIVRLPSETGTLAIKIAIKLKKKWAIEVVGCVWDGFWTHGLLLAKLFAPVAYLKTKNIISKAPYSLYVTKEFLQQRYPSKGKQTNCSNVEIDVLEKKVLDNKLKMLRTEKKPYKIGLIGSLATKTKGLKTAFKALSLIIQKENDVVFEIVGDGPQDYWLKLISKYKLNKFVLIKGTLKSGAEINEWLDSLHLYIQPSRTEGLPRALIEAMSRGCPAIGSNVGGIPELLDKKFLHMAKDYRKLSQIIYMLLNDKRVAMEQAKRNFEFSKNYSKTVLDKRRNDFWKAFADYCKE